MSRKKFLSIVLAFAVVLSVLPAFAAADAGAPEDSQAIEQYLNETDAVPADIVLVLDQSGSMTKSFDSSLTRQQALKSAAVRFVEQVSDRCGKNGSHKVSIVGFAGKAYEIAGWTELDEAGTEQIISSINSLTDKPKGASYIDKGLEMAEELLLSRTEANNAIVVLFSDGYPGTLNAKGDYFSNYYDTPKEADDAVCQAARLKSIGAAVYCIGAFGDANPAADYTTTRKSAVWTVWRSAARSMNGLMHFISSDYDASCTSWRNYTTSNDGRNNGYYFAASTVAGLEDAFDSVIRDAIPQTPVSDIENYFSTIFGDSSYYEELWPTMSSLRRVGDNIYLLDYQYDYDIDDLMSTGVSSAADLLSYASEKILGNAFSFKMGQWGTGCSAFEAHNEYGEHIMGRNFDYMDAPCYVVWTHPDDGYAAVSMVDGTFMLTTDNLHPLSTMGSFQSLLAPYLCLDGINETGFAISVLQIHADGTSQDDGNTDMFTTAMIRCCLDKCATVDEAIALFSSFDVQDTIALGYSLGCCFHYMVTDANGDAAVIEYVNNEMRVTRASDTEYDSLFVTNFYLALDGGVGSDSYDPEGMERYDIIADALQQNGGVLNFSQSFDLLSNVHLNYRHDNGLYDITTLWSCLYNNSRATMDLAARMDYSSIYSFSATEPEHIYNISSVSVSTPTEGLGLH